MADLGIIFLRRRYPIHWYQSSYIFITGSMPFRYFWATLYKFCFTELKLDHKMTKSRFKSSKKNPYKQISYFAGQLGNETNDTQSSKQDIQVPHKLS